MTLHDEFEARRLEMFEALGVPMEPLHLTDSQGREIYAMAHGSGEPVVFVHGGLAQAGEWSVLIPLVSAGRRLILVDRPGCGLSYSVDYKGVDYERSAAEFLGAVLDGLGLESADFVGNSMGGFFCLALALASPERVRSLGLIGAPAGLNKFIPYQVRVMSRPRLGEMLLSGEMTAEQARQRIYQPMLVADASRCDDRSIEVGLLGMTLPGRVKSAVSMLHNVVGVMGWRRLIRDRVAGLGVHTRFIWGDKDVFESAESGERLAAQMPDADFVTVHGAGHLPWYDEPERCAEALREFWGLEARLAA